MINLSPKTLNLTYSASRVALSGLLKLLFTLGVNSADPMYMYGGSTRRINMVAEIVEAGLISDAEARRLLGFPQK